VFLDLSGLPTQGKAWRDSTLRCLQEKIVPELPPDGQADSCDCKSMQVKAFDIHVSCYTQSGASICDLPATDWALIFNAIDPVQSLTDQKSRKQMVEVAKICLPIVAGQVKTIIQNVISKLTD
jgi:hypothetical protein